MTMLLYEELFKALAAQGIEYLVAGGFAVNFHQVQRATADLDLIVHLEQRNVEKFLKLVAAMGYLPKIPVDTLLFARADIRKTWIEDKGLAVLSFYNPKVRFETIDIFVKEPHPFDELVSRRLVVQAFGTIIPVVGIDDLIEMKSRVGRDKDLFDVAQLRKIRKSDGK